MTFGIPLCIAYGQGLWLCICYGMEIFSRVLRSTTRDCTWLRIMVTVGQPQWDDIKILGNLVCPFVCMSVCVYMVGRYQKFDGVPL